MLTRALAPTYSHIHAAHSRLFSSSSLPSPSATVSPKPAVACVVMDEKARVLLVQRSKAPDSGHWSLPGGRVELGESVREAAVREVREETRLELEERALRVLDVLSIIKRRDNTDYDAREHSRDTIAHHYVLTVFLAHVRSDATAHAHAGDDALALHWSTHQELPDLQPQSAMLHDLFTRALAERNVAREVASVPSKEARRE